MLYGVSIARGLGRWASASAQGVFCIVLSFFLIARSTIEFTRVDISSFSGGWEAAQELRASAVAAVAWILVPFWSHVFTLILVIFYFWILRISCQGWAVMVRIRSLRLT